MSDQLICEGGGQINANAQVLAKRMESLGALTMPKNRLSLKHNCYKIKLKNDGYRLAYTVRDDENGEVSVVAVDRRDEIYNELKKRLDADV
ncbi:TPA: type II toxin-antitoxin system RelE family toxin [Klebsiella pneumoniae]|uniref:type II toxin-antitoxin system RelE family toxin n=1 Tax=Klebsiella quasipneumoniae TaxID=1463165 RepID=UPI003005B492|nr:type II toxin-antitoxin system RelE/ParE family toxin [Klebsiella quasipneumoniae subsp. similipneumoniae]